MESYYRDRLEKLSDQIQPHIYDSLTKLYHSAKKLNPEKSLKMFQLCLQRIPDLPITKLENDYRIFIKYLLKKDDQYTAKWVKELLDDVFMSYAKFNIYDHFAKKPEIRKIDLNVPHVMDFIHRTYIESARAFWQEPFLFSDKFGSIEIQKNQIIIQNYIKEAIAKTVRNLVTLDQLITMYRTQLDKNKKHQPQYDEIINDTTSGDLDKKKGKAHINQILSSELYASSAEDTDMLSSNSDIERKSDGKPLGSLQHLQEVIVNLKIKQRYLPSLLSLQSPTCVIS
jgi:hypothetical protein